ncbi:unnamed protein product [Rotaria magnacalcarata]|uniref:RING-type domain-containing protein n=1 Tax=Rotaria magnacalcarata TaxID=392030 RepID=A0A816N4M3_9BILA|nr:unnamed protein product [Rotaria magnacalcarata]CAF1625738.1 unnamed protein product [Rotaria magnacalcarata]CAF1997480.1 unnamed protein product [Rotaria magnacalcarata]CAF2033497.1 unnamed protein product [Rotaria magnacalcarata]CAF3773466.1 unnamed protein product [Rotaria magnacalcarata]
MCHFCHVLAKNPQAPQHRSAKCIDKANGFSKVPMNKRTYENGKPNSQTNKNPTCSVCLDKPPDMVFIPCGHVTTCETCSSIVSDCPICRKNITNKQRIYLP